MTPPEEHGEPTQPRSTSSSGADAVALTELADWGLTERVAVTIATAAAPSISAARAERLRAELHRAVAEADPVARRVAELGDGLSPAGAVVVGRSGWIRANLETLRWLTDPLAERLLRRTGVGRTVARRAMAVQIGVLLGYLSARVLGQYEALRPPVADADGTAADPPGRLLLVGPNLLAAADLAEQEGVEPGELLRGVVLHELAHRLQFEGVPWLRSHLRGLLDAYLDEAQLDPDRLRSMARRVPELLADPKRAGDLQQWMALVLTPGQVEVLDQAQALMTVLEGHGNAVMQWGAADSGAFDPAEVRELLAKRRGRVLDTLARDALGLSMKAKQYAVGERFILDVADRHGVATVNRAFASPEHLPRTDELDRPDAWVGRVAS